jgi:hypothetical protein
MNVLFELYFVEIKRMCKQYSNLKSALSELALKIIQKYGAKLHSMKENHFEEIFLVWCISSNTIIIFAIHIQYPLSLVASFSPYTPINRVEQVSESKKGDL